MRGAWASLIVCVTFLSGTAAVAQTARIVAANDDTAHPFALPQDLSEEARAKLPTIDASVSQQVRHFIANLLSSSTKTQKVQESVRYAKIDWYSGATVSVIDRDLARERLESCTATNPVLLRKEELPKAKQYVVVELNCRGNAPLYRQVFAVVTVEEHTVTAVYLNLGQLPRAIRVAPPPAVSMEVAQARVTIVKSLLRHTYEKNELEAERILLPTANLTEDHGKLKIYAPALGELSDKCVRSGPFRVEETAVVIPWKCNGGSLHEYSTSVFAFEGDKIASVDISETLFVPPPAPRDGEQH